MRVVAILTKAALDDLMHECKLLGLEASLLVQGLRHKAILKYMAQLYRYRPQSFDFRHLTEADRQFARGILKFSLYCGGTSGSLWENIMAYYNPKCAEPFEFDGDYIWKVMQEHEAQMNATSKNIVEEQEKKISDLRQQLETVRAEMDRLRTQVHEHMRNQKP